MNNLTSKSRRMIAGALLVVSQLPSFVIGAEGKSNMPQGPEIKVISDSEKKQTIPLKKDGGLLDAEARISRLNIHFPGGKTGEEIIFVLRDPKTGVSWWDHQWVEPQAPSQSQDPMATFLGQHKFFLIGEKIVGFRLDGSRIHVRESRERYAAHEKALQGIVDSNKTNLNAIYGDPVQGRFEVPLLKSLGRSFFNGSKLVAQWRPSKLMDVDRVDSEWTLTLEGPDGERATIVLTDDYKVKRAVRNGKDVFPESKQQP